MTNIYHMLLDMDDTIRKLTQACQEALIALGAWAEAYPELSGVDAITRSKLAAAIALGKTQGGSK